MVIIENESNDREHRQVLLPRTYRSTLYLTKDYRVQLLLLISHSGDLVPEATDHSGCLHSNYPETWKVGASRMLISG